MSEEKMKIRAPVAWRAVGIRQACRLLDHADVDAAVKECLKEARGCADSGGGAHQLIGWADECDLAADYLRDLADELEEIGGDLRAHAKEDER